MYIPEDPPTIDERMEIWDSCRRNIQYREAIKKRCEADAAYLINAFGTTFDPRPEAQFPDLPFILFDFQVDYVRWLDDRLANSEDGIVEKSRDVGVSWVTVGWMVHKWLYRPGFQGLIGSRKEDYVDNGEKDSLFGKIEYFLENLPGWLLPKGFRFKDHRQRLKISNPENGNTIIGESANSNFSRAGRYAFVLFDEAAFWENLTESWRAAGSSTRTRVAVSTANGMNAFGRIRFDTKEDGSPRYPVLTLHARNDPRKGPEWIERERQRMTAEDFAQEIDISYNRSVRGVVYPEISLIPTGHFPFVKNWALYVSWDFGLSDDTALVWWARDAVTGKLRIIDCYANNQKPIDFYVPFVIGSIPASISEKYNYTPAEMKKITEHSALPRAIHYGDPSGKNRNQVTSTSVIGELAKWEIYVFTNDKDKNFPALHSATTLGIRRIEGINTPDCANLVDALINARFPERNPDSQSTTEVNRPIHDWTSHYRTCVEFFFVNEPPLILVQRPAPHKTKMAYDR